MLGMPRLRQIGGDHRIARVEADLQAEQHGALDMRLHGAAELAIDMAKEGRLPIGVETKDAAEAGCGSEYAGRGGTKKAQARGGRDAEVTGGVDP